MLVVAVHEPATFESMVKRTGRVVHTSLDILDTLRKASMSVVILTDLNDSEICVVNDDGFSDLSRVDRQAKVTYLICQVTHSIWEKSVLEDT